MMMGKGLTAAIIITALGSSLVFAAPDEAAKSSWWLNSHETVSKTIGNWSTGIDSFLSGEANTPEAYQEQESHVDIRFGSVLGDGDRASFFDFSAKLKLPNTQDRLRLVIESEPDTLAPESIQNESSQRESVVESALATSITAAVRYIEDDLGLDVDAGVRVDFPLDPFVRFRFKQGSETGQWRWWQNQEMFAYYSRGVGARYRLGLGYTLTPRVNYSTDLSVAWLDDEGLFYGRENLSLQHRLNDKSRLAYQLSFLQSGAHELEPDSYLYNVQYERLLYKNWLIGQVKPQFTHDADDDYHGEFSLTLSMVILLGPEYLQ
ncbi:hypothetical protein J9B83_11905 [Marinomonas sp. A79]|uniref:DUF3570 domain-containing protein n=1 Tax=Marinomonas vulgaris TaxID=2823372 RepID=A0ABS5HDB4_9GAMM|nr:hypothetical protein [Marinomonas vulgaris]MBR7889645.1 hypothetical protein [Marinomonas vulgaris]